jgi:hypothetical protein
MKDRGVSASGLATANILEMNSNLFTVQAAAQ